MNYSMLRIMFKLLLTFIFVVFFNSSAIAGDSFTFKWGKDTESDQPQVKHKQKKGGPPPHAPANGYRANRQYRYYPSKKVYHDNPNAATITDWTEWNISLQEFGVNLTNVNTITIGLDNSNKPATGGSGLMYFDDIQLYQPRDAVE